MTDAAADRAPGPTSVEPAGELAALLQRLALLGSDLTALIEHDRASVRREALEIVAQRVDWLTKTYQSARNIYTGGRLDEALRVQELLRAARAAADEGSE